MTAAYMARLVPTTGRGATIESSRGIPRGAAATVTASNGSTPVERLRIPLLVVMNVVSPVTGKMVVDDLLGEQDLVVEVSYPRGRRPGSVVARLGEEGDETLIEIPRDDVVGKVALLEVDENTPPR